MPTRDIFNAKTQVVEQAELSVDHNNEIVATHADGGVVKFPAGLSKDEFDNLIQLQEEVNTGQIVITPEMEAAQAAERQASLDLIGETDVKAEEVPSDAQTDQVPAKG